MGAAAAFFVSAVIQYATGNWRLILLVMVLPALLVFWIRRSVPESPLFVVRAGRRREASTVIDELVRSTGATVEPHTLPSASSVPRLSAGAWFDQLRRVWAFNWHVTAIAWSLFLSVSLVYCLALTWMPSILLEAGMGESAALFSTAGMAAVGLAGVVLAAVLVERVGRKWLLGITGPLAALVLVLVALSLSQPHLAVAWLLVFGFIIQIAIPVLYTYVSELYPTELRGSGFGWASSFSRLGAGFGPLLFAWLWPVVGLANSFLVAGGLVLLAVIWMALRAPETRGAVLR